jgi:glutamyl-tRNA synthetase
MIELLEYCGIKPDESFIHGGSMGPYIQSERLDIYRKYVDILVERGKAYRCFCEDCGDETCRCLNMSTKESETRAKNYGDRFAVRLRVPSEGSVQFEDHLRGNLVIQNEEIDHQILMKSSGYPTYHLASVVDDHLMKISHVIRGDEWLSSTPKHVHLYDAFEWKRPVFVHVPLLMNPDRTKISKRQAHAGVSTLLDKGFLASSVLNFVALMGWSPRGDHDDMMNMCDLIEQFDLNRVKVSPAIVNPQKLEKMNKIHTLSLCRRVLLQESDDDEDNDDEKTLQKSMDIVFRDDDELNIEDYSTEYVASVFDALEARVSLSELLTKTRYFFKDPEFVCLDHDEHSSIVHDDVTLHQLQVGRRVWTDESKDLVAQVLKHFRDLSETEFSAKRVVKVARVVSKTNKVGLGKVMMPLRYAVSGTDTGASLDRTLELLNKNVVERRLEWAVEYHDVI